MTTALYCVLAAGLMPYLWTAVAKFSGPRYNNWNVRIWQSKLEGAAQRAHAAHLNSFEAFPLFAVAVIVAQLHGADQARVDLLALSFIGLRILYGALYMANKATFRSLVWLIAMASVVMIFMAGK